MKQLFDFKNYQSFLLNFFQTKRGNQARLAEHLDCKSSFLTQVIDQKVHLSFEQSTEVSNFLGLNRNEKMAFILMVQKEKIQLESEKKFIMDQIDDCKNKNDQVKTRLHETTELPEEYKFIYYSSWIYSAIHILTAFKWIKTEDDIKQYLNLDRKTVHDVVTFLLGCELVQMKNGKLEIGKTQIHIDNESKFIGNHHINWRNKAIEKLNARKERILNFSSLIGISEKDHEKIKKILLDSIEQSNEIIQKSGEEKAYFINIDFMEL